MQTEKDTRANQVTIAALTVEIKALRVGTKQMTQALFRQLPKRSILDEKTGALLGTVWCHIRYFWGDCFDDHLHIVWEADGKIYRDCLYPPLAVPLTLEKRVAMKERLNFLHARNMVTTENYRLERSVGSKVWKGSKEAYDRIVDGLEQFYIAV